MGVTQFEPIAFTGGILLFAFVASTMLLLPLLIGRFLRPNKPTKEKLEPYECGEPTIGPSDVQFDLRFYVVALLFIIFDVEIAFFFPWAVVFGKANTLANPAYGISSVMTDTSNQNLTNNEARAELSRVLLNDQTAQSVNAATARSLMGIAILDMLIFFVVVLVGFAYVWRRGDLDWVRAVTSEKPKNSEPNLEQLNMA